MVKTLKVYSSETSYRDLYFSRLCPSCLDGCERGPDGNMLFNKKKKDYNKEGLLGSGSGVNGMSGLSEHDIKSLTDIITRRVREELTTEYQDILERMKNDAKERQDTIDIQELKLRTLERSLSDADSAVEAWRKKAADAKSKYEICKREVLVLRTAVQDSYRAVEDHALQQQVERQSRWREKGTHISCSVCAIRYEKEEHGHEGDLTAHIEENDRVLFPRAVHFLKRVKSSEILNKKKDKYSSVHEPFQRNGEEPTTSITKHRNTEPPRSYSNPKRKSVETAFGELEIGINTTQGSKFSQMKNIPPNSKSKSITVDVPMTKVQVSKVASFLQDEAKIAKYKKLHSNNAVNMTDSERIQMYKLLGPSTRIDTKKSQRPISAPAHKR